MAHTLTEAVPVAITARDIVPGTVTEYGVILDVRPSLSAVGTGERRVRLTVATHAGHEERVALGSDLYWAFGVLSPDRLESQRYVSGLTDR